MIDVTIARQRIRERLNAMPEKERFEYLASIGFEVLPDPNSTNPPDKNIDDIKSSLVTENKSIQEELTRKLSR